MDHLKVYVIFMEKSYIVYLLGNYSMLTPFQKKIDQETAAVLKNSLKILILILNLLFAANNCESISCPTKIS